MTKSRENPKSDFPRRKFFEANVPMHDHFCGDRQYRLDHQEDTGLENGGKTVIRYYFILVDKEP